MVVVMARDCTSGGRIVTNAIAMLPSALKALVLAGFFWVALLAPAGANAQVVVTVNGNTAKVVVGLPGILYTEMLLTFEKPANLTPQSLGASAQLVTPLSLVGRLPEPGLLALPLTYPVMIKIAPPVNGGLSFINAATVEVHTHALIFSLDNLFRLYKAPAGGTFFDMTQAVNSGSVRTSGRTGGFSDFIVLIDLIPNDEKSEDQFAYLDARTAAPAITNNARRVLQADLASSRAAFDAGNYALARTRLDTYIADVRKFGGKGVPNKWRAKGDLDNIAGDLIGAAASLQYTLSKL